MYVCMYVLGVTSGAGKAELRWVGILTDAADDEGDAEPGSTSNESEGVGNC